MVELTRAKYSLMSLVISVGGFRYPYKIDKKCFYILDEKCIWKLMLVSLARPFINQITIDSVCYTVCSFTMYGNGSACIPMRIWRSLSLSLCVSRFQCDVVCRDCGIEFFSRHILCAPLQSSVCIYYSWKKHTYTHTKTYVRQNETALQDIIRYIERQMSNQRRHLHWQYQ